ncbi:chalcone isomerase family protein [Ideonella sp. BN130291]|uniref:chalcone isomerase family protein n=1 Tax=Ideonella sp. BN130291 TaxID=3112940 RepID=UPI002E254B87|nr:chalcone isomerase family protein [Ideonella sp. BN130291]
MPIFRRTLLLTATALALSSPWLAQAQSTVEVGGVKYETTAQVGNAKLQLNGAGVRYKAIFKVYAAGLYLQNKATTTEAVIGAPGPRRMHIVMLRDIDANELGKLFTRGMQDNATKEEFARSINGTIKMGEFFATRKHLNAGDYFTVDYLPGTGTIVTVNGKQQMETVKEPEFFNALMHIWLGRQPADAQLKDALLGKSAAGRPET